MIFLIVKLITRAKEAGDFTEADPAPPRLTAAAVLPRSAAGHQ
jgi:hypothetical protein